MIFNFSNFIFQNKQKMKTETIQQSETFKCSCEEFYNAILNSDLHSKFSQSHCEIFPIIGWKFSVYDGYIVGENVKLEPNKEITQSWQALEDDWPSNHFSTITFKLSEKVGKMNLDFVHKGIPFGLGERYAKGWKEHYWQRMKITFNW